MLSIKNLIVELNEAAIDRYMQMFNFMDNIKDEHNVKTWAHGNIHEFMKITNKADKVTWFAKWIKLYIILDMKKNISDPEEIKTLDVALSKLKINNPINKYHDPSSVFPNVVQFLTNLQHHIFTDINHLSISWDNMDPKELLEYMIVEEDNKRQEIEDSDYIINNDEIDEYDDVLIRFDDGSAWFILNRGSCSVEARAMGHCGNVPSERTGDIVLSYRVPISKSLTKKTNYNGDFRKTSWKPLLTFILNNGSLGEMKGHANEKPAKKYNKYIMALLTNPIVKHIAGGGYDPDNNFNLNSLDTHDMINLLKLKPSLFSLETILVLSIFKNDESILYDNIKRIINPMDDIQPILFEGKYYISPVDDPVYSDNKLEAFFEVSDNIITDNMNLPHNIENFYEYIDNYYLYDSDNANYIMNGLITSLDYKYEDLLIKYVDYYKNQLNMEDEEVKTDDEIFQFISDQDLSLWDELNIIIDGFISDRIYKMLYDSIFSVIEDSGLIFLKKGEKYTLAYPLSIIYDILKENIVADPLYEDIMEELENTSIIDMVADYHIDENRYNNYSNEPDFSTNIDEDFEMMGGDEGIKLMLKVPSD